MIETMELPEERWMLVPGNDRYIVSDQGRVINRVKDREIRPTHIGYGLMKVTLYGRESRQAISLHRLVASVFLDDFDSELQVSHKSGVKSDNSAQNLEMGEKRVRQAEFV